MPTLEPDLPGGSATLAAGNPLIADVVPEYQRMRHPSSPEDVAVGSIQPKPPSRLSAQVLSNLKTQSMEGQYEVTVPAMGDRARQALYKLALDPIAETLADPNSYGFRTARSSADAAGQCFNTLARRNNAQWILEGDIKGCFDNISHDWLIANVPMDKVMLKK